MIDHAAAAVATSCDQCFQQLEAMRPIPQIAHHCTAAVVTTLSTSAWKTITC